jgi:hypothetical protein
VVTWYQQSQGWAWWYTPIISALGRLRHKDGEFQASLSYIVRHCLKKKKNTAKYKPRARDIAQWQSACLACIRPWVPSQHCGGEKKKKKERLF